MIHNPNFKVVEFDHFRMKAGLNAFSLPPKEWAEKTNSIGVYSKAGRYHGSCVLDGSDDVCRKQE